MSYRSLRPSGIEIQERSAPESLEDGPSRKNFSKRPPVLNSKEDHGNHIFDFSAIEEDGVINSMGFEKRFYGSCSTTNETQKCPAKDSNVGAGQMGSDAKGIGQT